MSALTVRELQESGAARSGRWHDGAARPWTLLEWAGAMCGEAGEAANVAKKILRIDLGTGGNEAAEHVITDRAALVAKLAGELAGTIIYAERVATEAGIDLEEALITTFNEKSIALGFPDRLGPVAKAPDAPKPGESPSTWITAYAANGSEIESRQHFHCARCGTREIAEWLTRWGFDDAAKGFVRVHRQCNVGDSDATGDGRENAGAGESGGLLNTEGVTAIRQTGEPS